MSKRRSFLVVLIMGIIKILTAVQEGIAWLASKRYRGQVIRGMEGEVFKHEILTHTLEFKSDLEVTIEIEDDDPMNDPDSWGEWQMRYDFDSREDR